MAEKSDRRAFLNKTLLGAAGLGAAYSLEEKILLTALEGQAAEVGPPKAEPAGSLPHGKIGNVSISRLFLGGNLIGGWAHSRDLMYVSQLFKAYNTEAKIFETLAIAEQHGINTVLIDPVSQNVVEKYKRQRGGKIQTMVCMHPDADEGQMDREIKDLVDKGATLVYTHGEVTDGHTRAERVHVLARCMELIKKHGVPAGIGSHSLETPMACREAGRPRGLLREDLAHGPLLVGHPAGKARGMVLVQAADFGPRRLPRQHVVPGCGEDDCLHGKREEALGSVQGHGGRRDPAANGFSLRLPPRRRLRGCRDVRLPHRGRREARRRRPAEARPAQARLVLIYPRLFAQRSTIASPGHSWSGR